MAPHLYIYGLTRNRDEATIARFIDQHVDVAASEHRHGNGLAIEPVDTLPGPRRTDARAVEWASSVSEAIEWGIAHPRRAFFVWLTAQSSEFDGISLGFTEDDQLSLGFCIDDSGDGPDLDQQSHSVLSHLFDQFPCHLGLVAFGRLPPRDEAAFRALADDPLTMIFFSRDPRGC